ncbi:UNVERIFIED_CONTAM: hypothetical protein GTU68_012880 [Idotea baltica]|nr:hypothetical protein [Idotea baltica]
MADTTPNTPEEETPAAQVDGQTEAETAEGTGAPPVESPDPEDAPFDFTEAAEGDPDQPPQSPLEFLQQQLVQVEAERDETKDKLLRSLAEGENIRRRAMRDREEGEKYGGVRLARDLLAVYDNLERALQAADDSVRASAPDFIEGVELTQRELLNAFSKHQIKPVSPDVGERFDANLHQAMFESPAPGAENGTIIQVMQQGFRISDRLLRAAMVGVAKNPVAAKPATVAANDDAVPENDAAPDDDSVSDPTQTS